MWEVAATRRKSGAAGEKVGRYIPVVCVISTDLFRRAARYLSRWETAILTSQIDEC